MLNTFFDIETTNKKIAKNKEKEKYLILHALKSPTAINIAESNIIIESVKLNIFAKKEIRKEGNAKIKEPAIAFLIFPKRIKKLNFVNMEENNLTKFAITRTRNS